ncbi:LamG domain-containing protein [Natronosporangium hydrolyticum]|uniref:LamG domain-containing protein n=1 Tax=Natronosporangium hydrolyticum TaxID=2811111 RepID=A0A895YBS7_9ACTN|nr:LamG domain-containing protein [Natronosporangium hydrolyticum]QSB15227.1 LamG domain-containing protein [Natronosporangium hydrolyticum]
MSGLVRWWSSSGGRGWTAKAAVAGLVAGVALAVPTPAVAVPSEPPAPAPPAVERVPEGVTLPLWWPYPPDQLAIDSDCYDACADPAVVRSPRPWLAARVRDSRGAPLRADFQVRDGTGSVVAAGSDSQVPSGATARWRPPADLATDETYSFRVRAVNWPWASAWSAPFTFTVVTATPATPLVTSTDYPPADTGIWSGGPGQPGEFLFDPAGASDVVAFTYRWLSGEGETVEVDPGESATVELAPPGDLQQVLQVRSINQAGGISDWFTYSFLVRPVPNELLHWRFDEGEGATATPVSGGSAHAGTLHDGVSWVPSGINPGDPAATGTALAFDGETGFVSAPPAVVTDGATGWTVAAWVSPEARTDRHTVLAQGGTTQSAVQLQYRPEANQDAGGVCLVVAHADATDVDETLVCAPADQVPVGEWSHVAAVHDPMTGQLELWVDGGPFNGEWPAGWSGSATAPQAWSADGDLQLGRGLQDGAHGDYWQGRVDELRIYQRPLSGSELTFLFLQCRYGDCPA